MKSSTLGDVVGFPHGVDRDLVTLDQLLVEVGEELDEAALSTPSPLRMSIRSRRPSGPQLLQVAQLVEVLTEGLELLAGHVVGVERGHLLGERHQRRGVLPLGCSGEALGSLL
jgi:hypothetical protein